MRRRFTVVTILLFFLTCCTVTPFGYCIGSTTTPSSNIVSRGDVIARNHHPIHDHHDKQKSSPSTSVITTAIKATIDSSSSIPPPSNPLRRRGEYESNFLSRITYRYASPLLPPPSTSTTVTSLSPLSLFRKQRRKQQQQKKQKDQHRRRRLTANDAFPLPAERGMERAVPALASIYDTERRKHDDGAMGTTAKMINEDGKNNGAVVEQTQGRLRSIHSLTLAKSLLLHQKSTLRLTFTLRLINTLIQSLPSLLVSRLLRQIENPTTSPYSPILTSFTLVSILSLKMITENQYFHHVVKCATDVRGMMSGLIFDKSLKVPKNGESEGRVLNLMQSDAAVLESAVLQLHTIWDGPLQISIYSYLLYQYLGKSALWGIAVLLTTIPMNSITLRVSNYLSRKGNEAKDARVRRTSEAISNMKLVKLLNWENPFLTSITLHRTTELTHQISRGSIRALNSAIANAVPILSLVVTLYHYSTSGLPINASTIFTAISLFNQLRFPLFFYPLLIDALANGRQSLRRVSDYLNREEVVDYVRDAEEEDVGVKITNGNFQWAADSSDKSQRAALSDINLRLPRHSQTAVMGGVGSGKTALMKSLLGELRPLSSTTHVSLRRRSGGGGVAYCSQDPWLSRGTLRDAILFGRPYDPPLYRQCLHDAGLDDDFTSMTSSDNGVVSSLSDETDVGEGGQNLSGGQRARVALARALYMQNDVDVYLLDDVLSALDARVGSIVFDRVKKRLKEREKTVLWVTNDGSVARGCDGVVLMGMRGYVGGNTVLAVGGYDDLIMRGYDLRQVQEEHDREGEYDDEEEESEEEWDEEDEKDVQIISDSNGTKQQNHHHHPSSSIGEKPSSIVKKIVGGNDTITTTCKTPPPCHADPDCCAELEHNPEHLAEHTITTVDIIPESDDENENEKISKELTSPSSTTPTTSSSSTVPFSTYLTYLTSISSPLLLTLTILSYITANTSQFLQQLIISSWTSLPIHTSTTTTSHLTKLAHCALVTSLVMFFRSYLTMRAGLRAGGSLHRSSLHSVFRAPLYIFSKWNPGQLLTRFGRDMDTIDRSLPDAWQSVLYCSFQIGFAVMALGGAVSPLLIPPIIAVGYQYAKVVGRYRPAARDLKRVEMSTRGPVVGCMSEVLAGVETVRSARGEGRERGRMRGLIDENLRVFGTVKSLDRWLSVRLETLGNVVVLTAAVGSVVLTQRGLSVGRAGWGLTQSLSVTGLLTWAVRCFTDLETQMMSVTRVEELMGDNLPREEIGASGETMRDVIVEPPMVNTTMTTMMTSSSVNETSMMPLPSTPRSDTALVASGWPYAGHVSIRNLSARYSPSSPLVLRNVTVDIPAGSTLGIVGRTGSGKSSLLLALFRLIEWDNNNNDDDGTILIDSIDLRSLSPSTLRSHLAIIPQNPTLFSGTLRSNLDPTNQYTNDTILLTALQTASPTLASQLTLDSIIAENGSNLSAGQRQLICLARALLKNTRVLIMDEATSSVDAATDRMVQDTIKREFVRRGVTVLTVAHRLETVLGYDKILVLGDGEVMEWGSPEELLSKDEEGGELRRLVEVERRMKKNKGGESSGRRRKRRWESGNGEDEGKVWEDGEGLILT